MAHIKDQLSQRARPLPNYVGRGNRLGGNLLPEWLASKVRLSLRALIFVIVVSLLFPSAALAAGERVMAIVGGTLIDGTGAAPQSDVTILIRGDRIVRIGSDSSIVIPQGATVIHAQGKFVLPGFIDAHIHYRDYFPELLITYGITSCADWGGSPLAWELAQRDGVQSGKLYGPRIYTSGELIGSGVEATDVEAALLHVRRLAAAGVNKIDMGFDPDPKVVTAVIHEAHKLGLPVSGYPVHTLEAIEAGIDAIKHTYTVGSANIALTDPAEMPKLYAQAHLPDRSRDARLFLLGDNYGKLVKLMVAHKVAWVPTLVKDYKLINDRRDEFEKENIHLLSNPELQYIPISNLLLQVTNDYSTGIPLVASGLVGTIDRSSQDYVRYRKAYKNLQGLIRALVQAGGHVLAGTAPHSFVLPGLALHQEMELLVDAGLTPMQALQAASLWVAEYLRVQKDIGSVEVGKLADIVILKKNPLDDIRNTRTVETVIQGGRVLPTGFHHFYVNPIPRVTEMNAPGVGFGRPHLRQISPSSAPEGSGDLMLNVIGSNFGNEATVMFENIPLKTDCVSSTQLKATIPGRLLRAVGSYSIHVWNPRPGGGNSLSTEFIVEFK
jgi:imidazolonepropionase-like amidohydrolase